MMLDAAARGQIRAIAAELEIFAFGKPSALETMMPAMHESVGLATIGIYAIEVEDMEWRLARFHTVGMQHAGQLMRRLFAGSKRSPVFYDPLRVPASHRNRVFEARGWIDREQPGRWATSPMCVHVLRPAGFHEHYQPRVLVCEGPTLLGWFGGLDPEPMTLRQRRGLSALVGPVQRRLSMERRLRCSALDQATLEFALDHISGAAFVLDDRAGIKHANAAARRMIEVDGRTTRRALQDSRAGDTTRSNSS